MTEIAAIRCADYVLRMKDPAWKSAGGVFSAIEGQVVTLRSADGLEGRGIVTLPRGSGLTAAAARDFLDAAWPTIEGRDVLEVAGILADIERLHLLPTFVLCGLDAALHELMAVTLDVPLAALFGGIVHRKIPQARMVPIKEPAEMARIAAGFVAEGYRHIKVKVNGEPRDVERLTAVRDALEPDIGMVVDANQALGVAEACGLAEALARLNVAIFEQPTPAADLEGLRTVRRTGAVLVEADESAGSLDSVKRILDMGAADIVNLKAPKAGGLRNMQRAAHLCEAAGIPYRFGTTFVSTLMQAQTLEVAATLPNHAWASELAVFADYAEDPFTGLSVTGGGMAPSLRPDSGVAARD
jgi:L-Ala-D/L-Glu epimerase / N-acetyl-D-glutamate racemase